MEATGGYVKEIGRVCRSSPRHAPYLLLIPARGLHVGHYPPQPVSVLEPSTTLLPVGSGYFLRQTFSQINTPTFSNLVILHIYPPMKMGQSVPKRRHIKFRRRGITQKKAYYIQNTAKV